ncbi:N-acetylmuramoyl-L-alanine amidase [Candidatus Woesearchaeota archaeon]|nr:N-acetylmuramoyl-L-alanine amidase [Candidatus Woesearchaeota archaeon]
MAEVRHISISSKHKSFSSLDKRILPSLKAGLDHIIKQEPDEEALKGVLLEEWLESHIILPQPVIFQGKTTDSIEKIVYHVKRQGKLVFLEADYPINYSGMEENGIIDQIAVHHTGNGNNLSVPSILSIHAAYNQWDAIGYHYIINKDGVIIRARPEKYEGAHITGQNNGKIAIAFSTNQNNEQPSEEMLKSYLALKDFLDKKFGIMPEKAYGHIQYSLRRINHEIERSGIGLEPLCEEEFLSVKKVHDFSYLKKKHLAEIERKQNLSCHSESLGKIHHLAKNLRACPGVMFYQHLERS